MEDFNNLGQIPPDEFKRMMSIEDVNQRENAIKNWKPSPQSETSKVIDGRLHVQNEKGEFVRVPISMDEARQKSVRGSEFDDITAKSDGDMSFER